MLVHPSLHDSGGWVCLEAMAAGKPVICLDLGGPGEQVTRETGFKIPALDPDQAVKDMARAMAVLARIQRCERAWDRLAKTEWHLSTRGSAKGSFSAASIEESLRAPSASRPSRACLC